MFSAASQKYIHEVSALGPQSMYVGNGGMIPNYTVLPSKKKPYMTIQTVVLTFSVLLCIFCCLLTVILSNKWHSDTNAMIGRLEVSVSELLRDSNILGDFLKKEIEVRRLKELRKVEPKNIQNDYNDVENEDDYEENKFMDKILSDNVNPMKNDQDYDSHKLNSRQRRNAAIDSAIEVKNELINSSNNERSRVESIEKESTTEENTIKLLYNRRKQKKMETQKKKPDLDAEKEVDDLEDVKEVQEISAAHFSSNSSKYSKKTHPIYNGNGRLVHPDGDFRDWSQYAWDSNLSNSNNIQMKNGKVQISKPGLYFVYAQIFYSDEHDINGYYIMKNDEKVLGCTTIRHRETLSDSCFTAGLIYFNSNDWLSIKSLDKERCILLDHVKTFFGLFRVSKDSER